MRSKLLRALAHIKAAKAHLAEASALLAQAYNYDAQKVLSLVDQPLHAAGKDISQRYADAVVAALDPAKLPK